MCIITVCIDLAMNVLALRGLNKALLKKPHQVRDRAGLGEANTQVPFHSHQA